MKATQLAKKENFTSFESNFHHEIDSNELIRDHSMTFESQDHQFERRDNNSSFFFSQASPIQSFIQPKLKIGRPNDKYEQEADRMADLVVHNINTPSIQAESKKKKTTPFIQKKCQACQSAQTAPDNIAQKLRQRKGQGTPLAPQLQAKMEHGFGTDFSQVRIHTGRDAIQMNQQLGARAFTYGSDVYFNRGEYQPSSREGQRLLAHELTHVVQQKGDSMIQRNCSPAELAALHTKMKIYCNQRRRCNMQTDTCATANAKIAAGNGCIKLRTLIQQKCFRPGVPGYQGHMQQIADAYAALRGCETVARAKCNQQKPVRKPIPVPVPAPQTQDQSTYEQIKEFAKRVIDEGLDAEQAAEEFLHQNPEIAWTIVILGSIGIVALIADDVTLAAIADDILIPVISVLVRVAWRFA